MQNTNTKQRVECRAMMYSQLKPKKYNTSGQNESIASILPAYYSQLIQFLPIFKLRVEKKEMPGGTEQLTTLINNELRKVFSRPLDKRLYCFA